MNTKQSILYELKEGIAYLTINRPEALNALNLEVLNRFSQLFDEIKANDAVKAVIISGAGKTAFSAGADIKHLSESSPLKVREFSQLAVAVTNKIEKLGKLVVAAINGYAFGGGLEISEACMIRVAVKSARLGHPEVKIGAVAGFGGTTRLARLVGRGRAAEMLLRGRAVRADEALQIGLVQFVVDEEQLIAETETIVREILAQSPTAVRLTWEALHRGLNMTLEESADLGADFFGLVAASEDFRIGTKAFVDKKRPLYVGR